MVPVIIDCTSCPVRELHCADCMVTALLERPGTDLALDTAERAAVTLFVSAGLVSASQAAGLRARREPQGPVRAVG